MGRHCRGNPAGRKGDAANTENAIIGASVWLERWTIASEHAKVGHDAVRGIGIGVRIRQDRSRQQQGELVVRQHALPVDHWRWPIEVGYSPGVRDGEMVFVGGQSDISSSGEVCHVGDLGA